MHTMPRSVHWCGFALLAFLNSGYALLQQPTVIPYHGGGNNDSWIMTQQQVNQYPQPLPPLADILNRPNPDIPPYGVFIWYTDMDDNNWRDTVRSFGWKTLRVGRNITDGSYDNAMRNMAGLAASDGVESFYTLSGVPRQQFVGTDSAWVRDYLDKVDELLGKYGPQGSYFTANPTVPYRPLKYLEIWNEPNMHYMYQGVDYPTKAAYYAKVLVAAYAHIRANPVWDSVKVIGFGACGGSQDDIAWDQYGFIERVFLADTLVAHSFDIFSNHPYVFNSPPDAECLVANNYHYSVARSFADYRQTLRDFGCADKPVWFTEGGWNRNVGFDSVAIAERDTVTERLQAAYVTRLYLFCLRLGVERYTTMFFKDGGTMNGGFLTHWWQTNTTVKRESGFATQFLTRLMPNPQLIGAISDGDSGYYAYRFRRNASDPQTDTLMGAWNVIGTRTVFLPCEAGKTYKIYDMLGNVEERTAAATQLSVEVGPCPSYIEKQAPAAVGTHPGRPTVPLADLQVINPGHGRAALSVTVPQPGRIVVRVLDMRGQPVATVADRVFSGGMHQVVWDGMDVTGAPVAGGIYFAEMRGDGVAVTRGFILIQ
jgi:hypothetical protein